MAGNERWRRRGAVSRVKHAHARQDFVAADGAELGAARQLRARHAERAVTARHLRQGGARSRRWMAAGQRRLAPCERMQDARCAPRLAPLTSTVWRGWSRHTTHKSVLVLLPLPDGPATLPLPEGRAACGGGALGGGDSSAPLLPAAWRAAGRAVLRASWSPGGWRFSRGKLQPASASSTEGTTQLGSAAWPHLEACGRASALCWRQRAACCLVAAAPPLRPDAPRPVPRPEGCGRGSPCRLGQRPHLAWCVGKGSGHTVGAWVRAASLRCGPLGLRAPALLT